jgi:hypothetical protein
MRNKPRRFLFWLPGLVLVVLIPALLIRPELAGTLTIVLILLATAAGAIWTRDND